VADLELVIAGWPAISQIPNPKSQTNFKSQISNKPQIANSKSQITPKSRTPSPKPELTGLGWTLKLDAWRGILGLEFEIWCLGNCLELGAWDLEF
jgi:hypothetical protein